MRATVNAREEGRMNRAEALARCAGSPDVQAMLGEMSDEGLARWVAEDRARTATHESGHAVLMTRLRVGRVQAITIAAGADFNGRTWVDVRPAAHPHNVACGAFAGAAAVHVRDGEEFFADALAELLTDPGSAGGDVALARRVLLDDERKLWRQGVRARALCVKEWPAITAVAAALIARETISGDEFRVIVKLDMKP